MHSLREQFRTSGIGLDPDRSPVTSPRESMKSPRTQEVSELLGTGGAFGLTGGVADTATEVTDDLSTTIVSHGKFAYEMFITALVAVSALQIPFRMSFAPQSTLAVLIVTGTIDWVFMADVVVSFFMPYLHAGGYFITKPPSRLARHYARTWFVGDVIGGIPWDFALLMVRVTNPPYSLVLESWVRFARLTRLVRVWEVVLNIREWELSMSGSAGTLAIAMLRIVGLVLVWLNTGASIWWLIYTSNPRPDSWITLQPFGDLTTMPMWTQYLAALYFATMTFTTVGYGDFYATTTGERAFALVYSCFSLGLTATVQGSVISWLQAAEAKRVQLADQLSLVKRYIRFRHIDPALGAKLLRHYRFRGFSSRMDCDEPTLLAELSPALRVAVAEHFRDTILSKWEFAQRMDKLMLTSLVLRLKRELRAPGETICLQGSRARKFFILARGEVALSKDGAALPLGLERYGTLGEYALFFDDAARDYTARALASCELLYLTRADLLRFLHQYPEYQARVDEYAASLESMVARANNALRQRLEHEATLPRRHKRHADPEHVLQAHYELQLTALDALPERTLQPLLLNDYERLAVQLCRPASRLVSREGRVKARKLVDHLCRVYGVSRDDAVYVCRQLLRRDLMRSLDMSIVREFVPSGQRYQFVQRVRHAANPGVVAPSIMARVRALPSFEASDMSGVLPRPDLLRFRLLMDKGDTDTSLPVEPDAVEHVTTRATTSAKLRASEEGDDDDDSGYSVNDEDALGAHERHASRRRIRQEQGSEPSLRPVAPEWQSQEMRRVGREWADDPFEFLEEHVPPESPHDTSSEEVE